MHASKSHRRWGATAVAACVVCLSGGQLEPDPFDLSDIPAAAPEMEGYQAIVDRYQAEYNEHLQALNERYAERFQQAFERHTEQLTGIKNGLTRRGQFDEAARVQDYLDAAVAAGPATQQSGPTIQERLTGVWDLEDWEYDHGIAFHEGEVRVLNTYSPDTPSDRAWLMDEVLVASIGDNVFTYRVLGEGVIEVTAYLDAAARTETNTLPSGSSLWVRRGTRR